MNIELKLELGHRASLRTEPAPDGFTHDWMIFVRGTKGSNISHVVDRVVFHLHESYTDPNQPPKESKFKGPDSGYACFIMPIDVYFRNNWKSRRVRLEYELVFPLGNSPVYNICHEKLVFMNPPQDFQCSLLKAGGVVMPAEDVDPKHIDHYHGEVPHGLPPHQPFQTKQEVCQGACRENVGSVCRETAGSVCSDTVGSACSSELSVHGKCNPTRLNKSCGISYDLHTHPQHPPDGKEASKGNGNGDAVTVCGPKNIKVKLELGHRASIRDHPTRDGSTHDWMVFVRGIEGCNISHFIEKVVFHLHESFPNRKRVVKKPPYQVAESGFGGFVMPIEVYFRNDEEPKKVRFEYDLFLRLKGPPILNIHREKLLFKNPSEDFRRRLLKARGDWCKENLNSQDKNIETPPHVTRSLLRQFQEIEDAEKLAALNKEHHKEHLKEFNKEYNKETGAICHAENIVMSLDFCHQASIMEDSTSDGSTHSWTVLIRGFKGGNISYFIEKVVFHLHESYSNPMRVVNEPPYQISEYGFAGFVIPIDVYLKSEEEPKKLRFQYDMYLGIDSYPLSVISREKIIFQNPLPDLRDRLLRAGGVLVHRKCPIHHQDPKDHPPPPPVEEIPQREGFVPPSHHNDIEDLEAIRLQEELVRKKCPVHHEDENCDTTLCATLLQHIQELEEAERANGNHNGRAVGTEPFMYLGAQRVDKKRNASIACFLMAKNAEQEDIQNKKLRIAPHNPCPDFNPCGAQCTFEDEEESNDCCASLPNMAPTVSVIELDCMLCAETKRDVLFYPCGHIAICTACSATIKECIICEEPLELCIKIGDCAVCSYKRASVIFEPCAHVCACEGCASLMKNCIQCQEHIEDTIPVSECCGDLILPDGCDSDPRCPSPYSDASTVEEIVLDTNFPENSNTDIEKLQQELQDIKEQTMCSICLDRLKNVIFVCGHGTCQVCSKSITKCPVCRKPVKKHIVLY